jgi:DNA-binding NarL/FixJ family response regulator
VDDSVVPRTAARAMIASIPDLRFVGEATSGHEALRSAVSLKPDLVLMDVHMPGMDGPAAALAILAKWPTTKIVAWTVSDSGEDLVRMMRAGCAGYVLKDAGPSELRRALLAAIRNESPVPRRMIPDVLRRIAELSPVEPMQSVRLTPRELQILKAVAKGHTTKRIAADLRIGDGSVETHLHNMFEKLGVSNRGEAVSAGLKQGVIRLADL